MKKFTEHWGDLGRVIVACMYWRSFQASGSFRRDKKVFIDHQIAEYGIWVQACCTI